MSKLIDITGQKFERLTAIERVENDKYGKPQWLCSCECGIEKVIASYHLRTGGTKSCGCMKNCEDLTGRKYGKMTVISRHGRSKNRQPQWLCRCECGEERVRTSSNLTGGSKNQSCGYGPCRSGYLGGVKTKGSVAYIRKILSDANTAAVNKGYEPIRISEEELCKFILQHSGCCDICGTPEMECVKSLCADHDHRTGIFRGLICFNCNIGLSHFKDNSSILQNAVQYVNNEYAATEDVRRLARDLCINERAAHNA